VSTRDTFRHAAVYSGASMLAKLAGFIMLPFYAHLLKGAGYGVIGMLDASTSFLLSLFAYGISSGLTRFYHEQPAGREGRVISTGLTLLWGVNLPVVALLMIFARPLSSLLLGDPAWAPEVRLALLAFLIDLTGQAAGTLMVIRRQSTLFSGISLLRLLTGLSLNIYLIVVLGMGLRGYFISSVVMALVSSAISHGIALRACGLGFDRRLAVELMRFQLPLIPGNLVSFVSRQVERVLLRFLISIESVGVLEMAGKFPSLIPIIVTRPFMRSWNTRRVEIAELPGAHEEIGRMFTRFLLLAVFAAVVLGVNIREVLELLTPPEFWPAAHVARIEIVSLVLAGSYYHLMFGLYYHKRTGTIALIRAVTSLVKIGLSYVFISTWGIYGAAWSACLIWGATLLWSAIKSQALYPIRIEYRKIALIVAAALVLDRILGSFEIRDTAAHAWLAEKGLPALFPMIDASPLGGLKDGRLSSLLAERAPLVASLMLRITLSFSYLLIFPLFHDGSRDALLRRWPRRGPNR